MNQNYQPQISEQICKIQTDKKLIALYDRLRYAACTNYAQHSFMPKVNIRRTTGKSIL